ncbi:hypothetical protein ANOM_000011 [Aspergillus nomiae NRRL 13137]|uniref:AMP-dependent synthetase/ligase domain-containing protein n=1 Tax=Aspergillus nomiae NRRL (strain ATCC 15546 / NRRL 13137 / CBS 260.88 / M93) TaxID=1509407 RepID=A0A0L1JID8_ASPN3|nr:uncharacterized protein ANOM_000011 [Aspergillus nomiae NRRL 13137]KNG91516.1 hypothetical protein ANOM_000011 [Aspergillus nomiae NRRL 13137]
MNQQTTLPNEPLFAQLLHLSKHTQHVVIHDSASGVEANAAQLLASMMTMRRSIYDSLPKTKFNEKALVAGNMPSLLVIAPGGYEYFVAAFATLSLGAAVVPTSMGIMPEEAHYLLQRCTSTCILAGSQCMDRAEEIKIYAAYQGLEVTVVPITTEQTPGVVPVIDEALTIPPDHPSMILFTSGSTGPPKGAVHSRRLFHSSPKNPSGEVFLSHRPIHWVAGAMPPLKQLLNGSRVETLQQVAMDDLAQALWERLRKGDVTIVSCTPPVWSRMAKYFQEHLRQLPKDELSQYTRGIQNLRVARVSGSATAPSVLRFWREMLGWPLKNCYASTEHASPIMETDNLSDIDLEASFIRCIGKPRPGVMVKLSEGDSGEILVKSPFLFSGYLDDEEATRAAFDNEGFHKTGDFAHRVGDDYVLDGRASTDFARYYGYKVPIQLVEIHINELPYIHEVVFSPPEAAGKKNLNAIRADLSDKLAAYQLPTVLRILQTGEEIPKAAVSGKFLRKQAVGQFFPTSQDFELLSNVEVWDENTAQTGSRKAWDWAGLSNSTS